MDEAPERHLISSRLKSFLMSKMKEGHIYPLKNVTFKMGEYKDGYLGMKAVYGGGTVNLKFTPSMFQAMIESALDSKEDFEEWEESETDCGLMAWINHEVGKLLGKK